MFIQLQDIDGAFKTVFHASKLKEVKEGTDVNGLGDATITEESSGYSDNEVADPTSLISSVSGGGKGHSLNPVFSKGVQSVAIDSGGAYSVAPAIRITLSGYTVTTAPTATASISSNEIDAISITEKGDFSVTDPELPVSVKVEASQQIRSVTVDDGGAYSVAPTLAVVLSGYTVVTPPAITATVIGDTITAIAVGTNGVFYPNEGEEQGVSITISRDAADTMSDSDGVAALTPVLSTQAELSGAIANFLKNVLVNKKGGGFSGTPVLTLKDPAGSGVTAGTASFSLAQFKQLALDIERNADYDFKYSGQKDFVKALWNNKINPETTIIKEQF